MGNKYGKSSVIRLSAFPDITTNYGMSVAPAGPECGSSPSGFHGLGQLLSGKGQNMDAHRRRNRAFKERGFTSAMSDERPSLSGSMEME
jgi:hypothetical protein